MDKIQKVLIQAGRKDIAQKYYQKVAHQDDGIYLSFWFTSHDEEKGIIINTNTYQIKGKKKEMTYSQLAKEIKNKLQSSVNNALIFNSTNFNFKIKCDEEIRGRKNCEKALNFLISKGWSKPKGEDKYTNSTSKSGNDFSELSQFIKIICGN
jgi:hypothetical protein